MMKNRDRILVVALILSLLAIFVGCATSETGGEASAGELKILSHSMTVHEFTGGAPQSTAVVRGRAQNVSNVTISFAMIAVNFYDKNKNLLATASAAKQNLRPGEVWDFNVKTVGPDAWKIVGYDIAASTK
jgi:hypothetical protein